MPLPVAALDWRLYRARYAPCSGCTRPFHTPGLITAAPRGSLAQGHRDTGSRKRPGSCCCCCSGPAGQQGAHVNTFAYVERQHVSKLSCNTAAVVHSSGLLQPKSIEASNSAFVASQNITTSAAAVGISMGGLHNSHVDAILSLFAPTCVVHAAVGAAATSCTAGTQQSCPLPQVHQHHILRL